MPHRGPAAWGSTLSDGGGRRTAAQEAGLALFERGQAHPGVPLRADLAPGMHLAGAVQPRANLYLLSCSSQADVGMLAVHALEGQRHVYREYMGLGAVWIFGYRRLHLRLWGQPDSTWQRTSVRP